MDVGEKVSAKRDGAKSQAPSAKSDAPSAKTSAKRHGAKPELT
jgi:hypothetical protein